MTIEYTSEQQAIILRAAEILEQSRNGAFKNKDEDNNSPKERRRDAGQNYFDSVSEGQRNRQPRIQSGTTLSKRNLELLSEDKQGIFRREVLQEALSTDQFPTLLREGIRAIMFDSFAGVPTTYQDLVDMIPSDKDEEVWTELERGGTLPIVAEQQAYPIARFGMTPPHRIRNFKRGEILEVTEEMLKFDKTNQIRQYAMDFGSQVAQTRESYFYQNVLTQTSKYLQTISTNDVGANTATLTFGSQGMEVAYATLVTMKDRASGRYLGIMPDTLVVTPRLALFARQLLLSESLSFGTGAAGIPRYGQGDKNPFRNLIKNIIVTPYMGASYQWALMQAKRPIKWQVVEDMQILTQDISRVEASESYFLYDTIRYRVRDWWGMDMFDDRFCYYSNSTTAPSALT